jgi:hypothetical protein
MAIGVRDACLAVCDGCHVGDRRAASSVLVSIAPRWNADVGDRAAD